MTIKIAVTDFIGLCFRNKLGKKIESGLGIFLKWKRKLVALLPINGFSTKSLKVGTVIGWNAT